LLVWLMKHYNAYVVFGTPAFTGALFYLRMMMISINRMMILSSITIPFP